MTEDGLKPTDSWQHRDYPRAFAPVGPEDEHRETRACVAHVCVRSVSQRTPVSERMLSTVARKKEGALLLVAVKVAVIDPLPLFRDGAVAALTAAGHAVQTPVDVVAWVRQVRDAVVVLTVRAEADWAVLAEVCKADSMATLLVALLEDDSTAAGVRAVRVGARSVLTRQASAEVLRRTVSATIEGQAVLPAPVAAALVVGIGIDATSALVLSAERLSWLRALAAGSTVAQLADQAGYSERAMFRLLRSLYRDMGVGGRVEALMRAQEQGWL
jgi:DNA-binding NarL/FixJ family response regulator